MSFPPVFLLHLYNAVFCSFMRLAPPACLSFFISFLIPAFILPFFSFTLRSIVHFICLFFLSIFISISLFIDPPIYLSIFCSFFPFAICRSFLFVLSFNSFSLSIASFFSPFFLSPSLIFVAVINTHYLHLICPGKDGTL